jgi:hypothetical protein
VSDQFVEEGLTLEASQGYQQAFSGDVTAAAFANLLPRRVEQGFENSKKLSVFKTSQIKTLSYSQSLASMLEFGYKYLA